ncbi:MULTISPECIES: STAS domain-containing protein [unclassified Nonomuraea]|uniref:STAS domain-containing protein n=1 Tax=unclassified Nonomuraea TaxID=2593643 RepID=UPI00341F905F
MTIEDGRRPGTLVVSGELDIVGKPALCTAVRRALRERRADVVLDVAGVSFIDAQGLSALVVSRLMAVRAGGRLRLVAVPVLMARLLRLTGLDRVLL